MKVIAAVILSLLIFSMGSAATGLPKERAALAGDIASLSYVKPGDAAKYIKVAFMDADSNLRIAPSGKPSANFANDVQVLPCVGYRLSQLVESGYLIAVASNQGGIKKGFVEIEVADQALQETMRQIVERNKNAFVHWYDFAEDYKSSMSSGAETEIKDRFRKPGRGMAMKLEQALAELGYTIDKEASFMAGDSLFKKKAGDIKPNGEAGIQFSNSDRCFAQNYGIRYFDPADFFGWLSYVFPGRADVGGIDLFGGKDFAIEHYRSSLPEAAKKGGAEEVQFCEKSESFMKYSEYLSQETPVSAWIADYQTASLDTVVESYKGLELCSPKRK